MPCQRSCLIPLVMLVTSPLSEVLATNLECTVFDLGFALPIMFARPAPDLSIADLDFSEVLNGSRLPEKSWWDGITPKKTSDPSSLFSWSMTTWSMTTWVFMMLSPRPWTTFSGSSGQEGDYPPGDNRQPASHEPYYDAATSFNNGGPGYSDTPPPPQRDLPYPLPMVHAYAPYPPGYIPVPWPQYYAPAWPGNGPYYQLYGYGWPFPGPYGFYPPPPPGLWPYNGGPMIDAAAAGSEFSNEHMGQDLDQNSDQDPRASAQELAVTDPELPGEFQASPHGAIGSQRPPQRAVRFSPLPFNHTDITPDAPIWNGSGDQHIESTTQPPQTRISYAQVVAGQNQTSDQTLEPLVVPAQETPSDPSSVETKIQQPSPQETSDTSSKNELQEPITAATLPSDLPILLSAHEHGNWAEDHVLWEDALREQFGLQVNILEDQFEDFREPLWILTRTRIELLAFDYSELCKHIQKLRRFLIDKIHQNGLNRKKNPAHHHPLVLFFQGDIKHLPQDALIIILYSRRPIDLLGNGQLLRQLRTSLHQRVTLWSKNQWQPDDPKKPRVSGGNPGR